jgi:RNA polymerase sigma-70 factor (ECF subfamily)
MAKLIAHRSLDPSFPEPKRASLTRSDKTMLSEAQFRELFEPHRTYLHRVAVKLSGDPELAKDLVQETFYRAWLRFDRFQQGTNARAWLATILTNYYFDVLKHQKVIDKTKDVIMPPDPVEHDAPLETIPDDYLHAAIQALDPDLREVVELCGLKQMRYREAAEALGVPPGTIATRLMRARASLRVLLTAMMQNSGKS